MTNWTVIQSSDSLQVVHIWRSRLESAGIEAQVIAKSNSAMGVLASGLMDPAKLFELWVPVEQGPQALLLLDTDTQEIA